MREYKFRAWDNEANLMIYSDHRNRELYDDAYYYFETDKKGELKCNWEPEWTDCCQPDGRAFNNLMQYTGLKDKNGVEIYESDIIKMYDVNCQLLWDVSGCLYYIKGDDLVTELEYCRIKAIEVVGNIYENAELVKEK